VTNLPVVRGPLSRVTALALTQRIRDAIETTWNLLLEAYEREAHKALGYDTWAEYVKGEFDISRGQSYRLIDQARVTNALMEAAGVDPAKVSHARDTIKVSAREAVILKREIEPAKAEVAEAVAAGATPVDAVRQAITKRQVPKPPAECPTEAVEPATVEPTVLEARVIPAESYASSRGDIMTLVAHIEETDPRDAARFLTERELLLIRRWLDNVDQARAEAKPRLAAVRKEQAERNVTPRFKKGVSS
jgi:copper chaperone CopZ